MDALAKASVGSDIPIKHVSQFMKSHMDKNNSGCRVGLMFEDQARINRMVHGKSHGEIPTLLTCLPSESKSGSKRKSDGKR